MRGSIKKRYEGSWSLILELGYHPDPKTGALKRKQKWITFRGNQRQAEKKLAELVNAHNNNELLEPSKMTVREWLLEWVEKAIKPPKKRPGTYAAYKRIIDQKLIPALGAMRLQQISGAMWIWRGAPSPSSVSWSRLALSRSLGLPRTASHEPSTSAPRP